MKYLVGKNKLFGYVTVQAVIQHGGMPALKSLIDRHGAVNGHIRIALIDGNLFSRSSLLKTKIKRKTKNVNKNDCEKRKSCN